MSGVNRTGKNTVGGLCRYKCQELIGQVRILLVVYVGTNVRSWL
jgi:hypothetical protein